MPRLNLTLDPGTSDRLEEHARRARTASATLARALLQEALDRRDSAERRRKLASDYARGHKETRELLAELEAGELELLE